MTYPVIKVKEGSKVPMDAPITALRFSTQMYSQYSWGYGDYKGLSRDAIDSLHDIDVRLVEDLKDFTVKELEKVKGIGNITAKRLVYACGHSVENYSGKGYPWEIEIKLSVPAEAVPALFEQKEKDVKLLLGTYIEEVGVFENLKEVLKEARVTQLRKQRADIEAQLSELQ